MHFVSTVCAAVEYVSGQKEHSDKSDKNAAMSLSLSISLGYQSPFSRSKVQYNLTYLLTFILNYIQNLNYII